MSDMKHDVDALETQDWLQALESVVREEGVERAQFLLETVLEKAR
ncbi:pyruvate dehydrogenase E1 component [Vibrio maritimus]|uniref:Pyruvate dehydrogenase E1 component n=2 Tax=Vibrio TaxID=662 RepID=A0A090T8Q1_9VIBR|nr:pyruvate dehydrogenase E1 component [Vibrio maritimus]